jgi:hypothetical protein
VKKKKAFSRSEKCEDITTRKNVGGSYGHFAG